MIDISPEGVAADKRATISTISDTEYQMWRHHPVTAGYLQYLDDQIAFMRAAAADLLESGLFIERDKHQDRNPDTLRGQIVMLRQIHGLTIEQIREFYSQSEGNDNES